MKIRVNIDYKITGTYGADEDQSRLSSNRGTEEREATVSVISDPKGEYEVPAGTQKVWVVGIVFNTYDTFGGTSGLVDILEVYDTFEDAERLAKEVRSFEKSRKVGLLEYEGGSYYIPGTGWGSELESIFVETKRLDEGRLTY